METKRSQKVLLKNTDTGKGYLNVFIVNKAPNFMLNSD